MKISSVTNVKINLFCEKLESVQYNAALAITGAIQGTSRDKIYQESVLEFLKSRRWFKCLSRLFKIIKEEAPNYLTNLVPKCETNTRARSNGIPFLNGQKNIFQYFFRFLFFILPVQISIYKFSTKMV